MSGSAGMSWLNFHKPEGKFSDNHHYTDEKADAQRGKAICLGSHSEEEALLGLNPDLSGPKPGSRDHRMQNTEFIIIRPKQG